MRKPLYLLCDLKYLASLPLLALQPQSPSQLKSMWLKKINTYIFCIYSVSRILNKDVYLIGAAPGGIPIGWGRIAASHTAPLLAPLLCPE